MTSPSLDWDLGSPQTYKWMKSAVLEKSGNFYHVPTQSTMTAPFMNLYLFSAKKTQVIIY